MSRLRTRHPDVTAVFQKWGLTLVCKCGGVVDRTTWIPEDERMSQHVCRKCGAVYYGNEIFPLELEPTPSVSGALSSVGP